MTEVAIIGGGPIGLLLGNLLGRRGIATTILERQPKPYPMPRAIHFDGEAMRCFQATGLADQILTHTHVGKGMLFKNAAGDTLIDWSRAQVPGLMGWYESYRFYQPGLEDVLRTGLGRFDHVTQHTGVEATGITQSDDSVSVTCNNGRTLSARYLIGCDGTQSFTREALRIDLHDLGFQERWLVIDAILKRDRPDLGDYSIQHCDPDAPGTYVRGVGNRRRWELRLRSDDPDQIPDDIVWQRLARWITPQEAELERSAVYTFRSGIAQSWRQGRAFIAGDAAHQMPPFMGQGMCAGVRDAANLAWKLAAVLHGTKDSLLDSYQSERDANARAFIQKSVDLGRLINQTAAGIIPQGQMKSIWPELGSGLGARDGIGGALGPQITINGHLSDDAARGGFYAIAQSLPAACPLPCFIGAKDWLSERSLQGVVVRPDGYALGGFATDTELQALERQAAAISLPRTLPE